MKKKTSPPKLANALLHTFLRNDLREEVSGDLEERFYKKIKDKSPFIARANYWFEVLNYVRPFAIRKSKLSPSNHYDMFQNYFKIGWRNLFRNKVYSFINIGGLAAGMSIALLIGLWIYDELSYDKYHPNYNQLVQVMQHQTFNGVKGTERSIPRPLENELRTTYGSDFKYLSMATWTGPNILSWKDNNVSKTGNFFQKDMPEMLSLEMVKGTRDALKDPSAILLSESAAKALFGDVDPMNLAIKIGGKYDAKVTGIYKDLPYNTSFRNLEFIAHWELLAGSEPWYKESLTQWGNNSFQLYAQLMPHSDVQEVSEKIKQVKAHHAEMERAFNPEIFLFPMADWHLRSGWKEGIQTGGRIQLVWLFGIIGVFVLLLACINFMNLSTARSEKRAKEVGIRMTIGSVRSQLINQFLSESFLVVLLAFIVSIGLVVLALPLFNDLADKKIVIEWSNPSLWLLSIIFVLFTSFVAGSYPAFYLSSFQPVKVLKGAFKTGGTTSLPRKILVVIQFTVSLMLIIGTITVYKQIQFTKDRPIGYNHKGIIMTQMKSDEFFGKFEVLRTELINTGAVEEVSESSGPVTAIWSNNGGLDWEGKDPALQAEFATVRITPEYGKTVGWEIKEGRDLSRNISTDSSGMIINEAAVKFMNLTDPVGKEIRWNKYKFRIVGVIKDMIMDSPYEPVKQTIYYVNYKNVSWINMRLTQNKSVSVCIAAIESVFKKNITTAPFEYKFVDDEFAAKFDAEERIGKLAYVFALLAILISCLGLFGLASFTAEQRTKEIGIRKTLGASVASLWRMLSKDFVVLAITSCAIAIPVSYYFLEDWLQNYTYRTPVSWWIFAVSSIGALIIILMTVSYQAVKAAMMNPVKSLRSE